MTGGWCCARARGSPARCAAAVSLQRREHVDQIVLAFCQDRKPAGRGLGVLAKPPNLGGSVLRQGLIAPKLGFTFGAVPIELLLDDDQFPALRLNPIAKPLDIGQQRAILPAREEQVLVARQEVGKGLRGQQHLECVERPRL